MRFRVSIGVLAGEFVSQQLAFAHLLDVAPEADFDQVEVLTRPFGARLGHYFEAGHGPHDVTEGTILLLLPGSDVPLAATDRLRVVGRFSGTITRVLLPENE